MIYNTPESTHTSRNRKDNLDNATGGRNEIAKPPTTTAADKTPDYIPPGFSQEDIKQMGGSLKVHVRLALEVDVRVIAKVKGDIAIGIL